MNTNSSRTNLIIGLAAFGLTLVVAGVRLFRSRAENGSKSKQVDVLSEPKLDEDETGTEEYHHEHQKIFNPENTSHQREKLPLKFFFLSFLLAVPFWLFGDRKLPLPINLPVSALATFVPVTAASIVLYQQYGFERVKALFKRAGDFKKIKNKAWYLPALFLMPLIYFLSYIFMRLAGLPLPDQIQIPLLPALAFLIMFFISDFGEELGWTGFATDPLQNRWGALKGSVILGLVWVIWHTIPWIQTGNTPVWIFWQAMSSVAARILMVWIYNNTGKSVFAATLVHITSNMGWALFPNFGTHYDPVVNTLISTIAAGIVVFSWGPKTLARYRYARVDQSEGRTSQTR